MSVNPDLDVYFFAGFNQLRNRVAENDGMGSVRVLRIADDRLDQFASEAIAKWEFEPATKNGSPVDS
jgi:hypothetical protein